MMVALYVILGLLLAGSGSVVGYELGHWLGDREGRQAGAAIVAEALKAQGDALASEAEAARRPALVSGAAARLKADWCRDCVP
jgi:hypothetical protein